MKNGVLFATSGAGRGTEPLCTVLAEQNVPPEELSASIMYQTMLKHMQTPYWLNGALGSGQLTLEEWEALPGRKSIIFGIEFII